MAIGVFAEVHALNGSGQILAATGSNQVIIGPNGPNDSRWDQCFATNNDVIDHVLLVGLYLAGISVEVGSVNLPAGTGWNGSPPVNVFVSLFGAGQPGLVMTAVDDIYFSVPVAVTLTNEVDISLFGGTL